MSRRKFTIKISDPDNSEAWDIPFDKFSFTEELNKDRAGSFSVSRQNIEDVATKASTLVDNILARDSIRIIELFDYDNERIFRGFLDNKVKTIGQNAQGSINVNFLGFSFLLDKRYARGSFINTPVSQIVTSLIRDSQRLDCNPAVEACYVTTEGEPFYDLGVTVGVLPTTPNKQRTYNERSITVKKAIEGLSNNNVINGIDWEMDEFGSLNIFYPERGEQKPNVVFSLKRVDGVNKGNIESASISEDGLTDLTNSVYYYGANGQLSIARTFESELTNTPGTHTITDAFANNLRVLESEFTDINVIQKETLNDKSQKELEFLRAPRQQFSIAVDYDTPNPHTYNLGDYVRVIIDQENINKMLRVRRREFDHLANVRVVLTEI